MHTMVFNPDNYAQFEFPWSQGLLYIFVYGAVALVDCLYPVAGHMADNHYGRFRMIKSSLYLLLPSPALCIIIFGTLSLVIFQHYSGLLPVLILPLFVVVLIVLTSLSLVAFNANIIQFGMDQLYDSPLDDQSLFIHWYTWTQYSAMLLTQFAWNLFLMPLNPLYSYREVNKVPYYGTGFAFIVAIIVIFFVLLKYSIDITRYKQDWFLIEPSRVNPYKLVYRVFKFARQHKVPVNRSAFTYCEDDLPSGLDLGKKKYGGPFTIEQVEDVKVFFGILKVLFSLGPVFFLNIAADTALYQFSLHGSVKNLTYANKIEVRDTNIAEVLLIDNGLLPPLLVTICIPLFIFLLRPLFFNYIPGMLKRIGIGIVLLVVSLVCSLIMVGVYSKDSMASVFHKNSAVILITNETNSTSHSTIPVYLFLIQRTLSSLSEMLIYIALYEFICSQSPHSMKGLLIGLSYAIKGLFQIVATALLLPFALIENTEIMTYSGQIYFLMNVSIGVFTIGLYGWISKNYKYRQRDEPSKIYIYAENYYSKTTT